MKTNFETETQELLFQIIADNVDIEDVDSVDGDTNIAEDLGVDSLDFLDIAFEIDQKFEIKLPIDELVSGKAMAPEEHGVTVDVDLDQSQEELVKLITIRRVAEYIDQIKAHSKK